MFLESGKLQWTKKERSFANFQAITTVTTFPNYTRIYYSIRSKGLYIMKPRISAVVVVVADVFFLLPLPLSLLGNVRTLMGQPVRHLSSHPTAGLLTIISLNGLIVMLRLGHKL